MKTITFALALTVAVAACTLQAQEGGRPPREGGGQGGRGGEGGGPGGGGQGGEQRRPKPPLITALDANGDGVIDAGEIANASEALKKLDKNGDGKLTQEECMPPRPQGGQGGPGGQGQGQGGEGRRGGRGAGGQGQGGPEQGGGAQRPELEK